MSYSQSVHWGQLSSTIYSTCPSFLAEAGPLVARLPSQGAVAVKAAAAGGQWAVSGVAPQGLVFIPARRALLLPPPCTPLSWCSYIEDSVAYLRGLVSPAEVLPVARQQRDRMLSKVSCT